MNDSDRILEELKKINGRLDGIESFVGWVFWAVVLLASCLFAAWQWGWLK